MGYTKAAISGFTWQTVLKLTTYALTIAKIFFLARLLTPADFGLFSLTAIALGISEAVTETGVNLTILQAKQSINYFLNTAWVIAIARGFLIGIMMIITGLFLGQFFANSTLTHLITLAALVPVIKGFINPAIVTLRKQLRFGHDSLYYLAIIVVEIIAAIFFAWLLHSVFALVLGLITGAIFEVLISFYFFTHRPRFQYLHSRAKIIFSNAKWLSPAAFLRYLNDNLDDLLIGKIVGTPKLGLYHNAYALSHKTNYELAKATHYSTIPIFTKINNDFTRLKKAFKKTSLVNLLIGIGVSLPILLFPDLIIKVLLGDQWLAAIPIVQPLVLAGILQAVSLSMQTLLLAKKNYALINFYLASTLILMTSLIYFLGLRFGLTGTVIALLAARALTLPLIIIGTMKTLKS
ncbi:MAG: oligosaccharide flippase family protein [Candidatus Pacebacteria bacterium]|nr:oligosaccharide flippase family protein [Candidatus Paceibacterota bacterium]